MSYQLGADSDRHSELFGEAREEEVRPRFRGLLASLIALLVLGVLAAGMWFAYMQGLRHASVGGNDADVPLIRADERPTKMKPDNPGGMEIPDRDKLIYTQKHPAVEHLLPPPEKPLPRPMASPSSPAAPSVEPPPAPAGAVQPAQPQPLTSKLSDKLPSAPATAAKSAVAPEAPANARGTRLQLGSVRSEEAARREWERIKRTNADLLASVSAIPTRADLGEKGVFYRIQTGPLADADRICSELKRRNVGCIIAR